MFYNIWSNEHNAWWNPGKRGYTNHRKRAGEYLEEEAIEICRKANEHQDFDNPDYPATPNECMVPVQKYDDGQGREYDILDEELD